MEPAAARAGQESAPAFGAADILGQHARHRPRHRRHRRLVVAPVERTDRARSGDAVAEGGDRREFRRQAYGLGRRHAARARRGRPRVAASARHHCARRRWHHRGERAQGGSRSVRLEPAQRHGAGEKSQSGRRRNGGAHREGRQRHRVRRRQQAPDCHRGAGAGRVRRDQDRRIERAGAVARRCRGYRRLAGVDRRTRRHRPRRPRSARTRPQEWQSDGRRSAQRQALVVQPDQRQPDAPDAGRSELHPGVGQQEPALGIERRHAAVGRWRTRARHRGARRPDQ